MVKYQLHEYKRAPDSDNLRQVTFCPGLLRPATDRFVRRVGRTRNEWAGMLLKECLKIIPSGEKLLEAIKDPNNWKQIVSLNF